MKSLLKKAFALILTATMAVTTLAVPASAAWKTTDNGVQWTDSNGKVVKSKWITMKNGNKYYINSKGYRVTGLISLTQNKVKNYYYFDPDGIMQTGWQLINNKYYYFQSTGKAVLNKKITINNYSYKFDSKGVWNKKVYNAKTQKDVTKSVNIEKLTGIKSTTSKTPTSTTELKTAEDYVKSLGKIPATVTICGVKVNTNATYLPKEIWNTGVMQDATDKDLENLKYCTKLTLLVLNGKCFRKNCSTAGCEGSINITNLDFCKYMPNLKKIDLNGCTKLESLDGLKLCTKLEKISYMAYVTAHGDKASSLKTIGDLSKCSKLTSLSINGLNPDIFTDWDAYKRLPKTRFSISLHARVKDTSGKVYGDNKYGKNLGSNTSGNMSFVYMPKLKTTYAASNGCKVFTFNGVPGWVAIGYNIIDRGGIDVERKAEGPFYPADYKYTKDN